MLLLTTCWTCFRIWARRITQMSYLAEDYLYFTAQLSYYGAVTCFILAVAVGGAGHDIWDLDQEHKHRYFRAALATQVLYAASLGFVKLSITRMLQRIFFQHSTTFCILSWIAMGLSVCWALYAALINFVICQPVQRAWDPRIPATCGDRIAAYYAIDIFDIVTDLLIVGLPVKFLAQLQVRTTHKTALYGVFCAGIITMVFSCIRLYYVHDLELVNVTKGFAGGSLSGVLQAGIAVMVASSPMLRPVFDRTVGRVLGLQSRSCGNGTTSNATATGGATRTSTARRLSKHGGVRNDGFKQMSDSDEHLAWEMRVIAGAGGRDSPHMGTATTQVNARHSSDNAIEDVREVARDGKILVTTTTEVVAG
ncbi:integral membrane protein [Colletotrichum plurivorum]|uniref:Integral membrane protein n=1 Tax=Colletotrichum plurivorum TaxID=2175906 RepID=A0A8H6NN67_9PEZI|nr:integral membrane protein [Colletotrichum plurivorum]